MTAGDIALIAFGVSMAALALWALWPRSRPQAGPGNNWRQRSGDDVGSGKTGAATGFDSPYSGAVDVSGD